MKNIAIIGSGGAGATLAWRLNKHANISVFEAESDIGGHAYSGLIKNNDLYHVDMGVELFTEKLSPNLCALLDHFNIPTFVAPLSFAAYFPNSMNSWNNSNNNGKIWDRIALECNRFHLEIHKIMQNKMHEVKTMTLRDFIYDYKFSKEFVNCALLPLLTTFSGCRAPILDYSLTYTAISFNSGLLSFFQPTYWRKSHHGIGAYLNHIKLELGDKLKLNSPVTKVIRNSSLAKVVVTVGNQELLFDEVVFATHADQALKILGDPSTTEREILSNFEYVPVTSILHSDTSILQEKEVSAGMYCEYTDHNFDYSENLSGHLTRNNNQLFPYKDSKTPLLVTFDHNSPESINNVHLIKKWKLPKLRPQDMQVKLRFREIQGKNHTWFCGTDTSFTGHEGAILSGLVIAEALGARYPFRDNSWAKVQFDVVKNIMGVMSTREKINSKLSELIFKAGKYLNIQQQQIARVLLSIYT